MKKTIFGILFVSFVLAFTGSSFAQVEPIIFPKEGQSRAQKAEDKGYCGIWSREETGVDPSYIKAKIEMADEMIIREAQSGQQSMGRKLFRGAARGAAMGAVGSNVDNNVGKRAIQGGMFAGMRSRDARKKSAQEQRVASQVYRKEQLMVQYNSYFRAFSACMEAKGYSVK